MTQSKPLLSLCAADIMSDHVVMVPREMSLQGAARMLTRAGVTGAPVVDEFGRCIGVLSTTDFMHWVEKDHKTAKAKGTGEPMCSAWQLPDAVEAGCRVEEFMTRDPVLAASGTKIGALARMMMDAHIHRIIVVDGPTGRPIGIVSSMDMLAALARAEAASGDGAAAEPALTGGPHREMQRAS
jgi:CBS domain-containing protein